MYIVMMLQKSIKTELFDVNAVDGDHLGFLSVFKTKKAARKVWGKDVELLEIEVRKLEETR